MSIVLPSGYADGEIAKQVTKCGTALLNDLFRTEEEAITRMIVHATDLCKES